MTQDNAYKVSYCTTCKGRLHHLKETLPKNLAAEKGNPNVEFVVLDYGSEDGLAAWIKENFQNEMASGRLKYVRYDDAPYFQMAHAKNMAHRMATGDILCNVDADNTIAPDTSRWLNEVFHENPRRIVSGIAMSFLGKLDNKVGRRLRKEPYATGIQGRIALMREDFEKLGGYSEQFNAYGGDDGNMVLLAKEHDLEFISLPNAYYGHVIEHSNEERLKNFSEAHQKESRKVVERSTAARVATATWNAIAKPEPIMNADGNIGCGTVHVNFSDTPVKIGLLHPQAEQPVEKTNAIAEEDIPLRNDWRQQLENNAGHEYSSQQTGFCR